MKNLILLMFTYHSCNGVVFKTFATQGGLAQVVERSICIREAPGSIPGFSNFQNRVKNVSDGQLQMDSYRVFLCPIYGVHVAYLILSIS